MNATLDRNPNHWQYLSQSSERKDARCSYCNGTCQTDRTLARNLVTTGEYAFHHKCFLSLKFETEPPVEDSPLDAWTVEFLKFLDRFDCGTTAGGHKEYWVHKEDGSTWLITTYRKQSSARSKPGWYCLTTPVDEFDNAIWSEKTVRRGPFESEREAAEFIVVGYVSENIAS